MTIGYESNSSPRIIYLQRVCSKDLDEKTCLWVPSAMCEQKEGGGVGLSRLVYGGVSLQRAYPRVVSSTSETSARVVNEAIRARVGGTI